MDKYNATQRRILQFLSDGLPHKTKDVLKEVLDEFGTIENLRVHVSQLRAKLRMIGEDILCEYKDRGFWYRHVRLLGNPYRG